MPVRDDKDIYGLSANQIEKVIRDQFPRLPGTLRDDQRQLLERFQVVDLARKVVGVGSVGTRAFIVLLQGRPGRPAVPAGQGGDRLGPGGPPAQESLPPARRAGGLRAADDAGRQRIYLGWTKGADVTRHFYWRQLQDMKGSADVEAMIPVGSGSTPASAAGPGPGARPLGDPIAIAEYLGEDDQFDQSITDFSERYADQNERDYQGSRTRRSGRLQAVEGV